MGTPDRYRHITWIRSLLCSYEGNILSFRMVSVYETWQDSPLQGKHCGIYLPPNCPVCFHVVSFMFSCENEAHILLGEKSWMQNLHASLADFLSDQGLFSLCALCFLYMFTCKGNAWLFIIGCYKNLTMGYSERVAKSSIQLLAPESGGSQPPVTQGTGILLLDTRAHYKHINTNKTNGTILCSL